MRERGTYEREIVRGRERERERERKRKRERDKGNERKMLLMKRILTEKVRD